MRDRVVPGGPDTPAATGRNAEGTGAAVVAAAADRGEPVHGGPPPAPLKYALGGFTGTTRRHAPGEVRLVLHGGRAVVTGRRGEGSRHGRGLATHDERDTSDQPLAEGFVRSWGLPSKIAAKRDLNK
ncbi:argininosuccinate synthase domain-containing protein [Saccharothrix australiensis]|uniref:argininosuccinate synthase domain-containing protein n=1 Tax=Saccharothrix australiensis TaxID=2072 RepID=UPI000EB33139|nr:argininosuccinate synthase domain-containing protein [Saccharothrix australiensis]